MAYPTGFTETLEPIQLGTQALDQLAREGFEVTAGVRRADVAPIANIAGQLAIREFCPKDQASRFPDEAAFMRWFNKPGGRGMFVLRRGDDIAGYGWTGTEPCEQLPACETTFALRLNGQFAGRGLGAPFTAAILTGSMALFGARRIGLETWASNTAAVKTYLKAGASLVTTQDGERPTLAPTPCETDGKRRDVRLYMHFPQTF